MKTAAKALVFSAVLAGVAACELLQDPTPEFLFFQMEGTPGSVVDVIYSKQFVVGINESGITRLEIFGADTVAHTLPIDTVIDIRLERQLYIQVETPGVDPLDVSVRVDIDDRNVFAGTGDVFPGMPWRYAYLFNVAVSADLEVIF